MNTAALLGAAIGGVITAALVTGALALRAGGRPPEGSMDDFRSAGGRTAGRSLAVVMGASAIHGRASVDAIPMVRAARPDWQVVNAGHNGDVVSSLLARSGEVIACRPDAIAVHPGGNDAFGPGGSIAQYEAQLNRLVVDLTESGARVGLISLQLNGDDLSTVVSRRVTAYNDVIWRVASECGVAYLPLRERMLQELEANPGGAAWQGPFGLGLRAPMLFLLTMIAALTKRYLLGQTFDQIAARRGFRFNTDGAHLNTRGASLLAEVITEFLDVGSARATLQAETKGA